MTAPVGWIANRFGRKRIFILCSGGFTLASVMCGLAQDINQMVLFRLLQGVFGAALVPLSQAVMLDSYALHERAKAMSIWGMGVMMGPIMGPSLGALADRDLFLALGVLRQSAVRHLHRARPPDLHGRDQEELRAALRLVRLPGARGRHRLAADRARPRRAARLAGIQRNHRRVHRLGASASTISSRIRSRRRSRSSSSPSSRTRTSSPAACSWP